ncbi:MAG TPA: amidohydrolase [Puia sp.]|nr:amidohydrolase [Puia sp.]
MLSQKSTYLFAICCLVSAVSFSQQDTVSTAKEKVFYHARIFTANINQPYAEAVAIRDDKIIAVGNYTDVKKTVSANALQIDLDGKFLLPGFIDSHEHSISGGNDLTHANTFDSVLLGDSLMRFVDDAVQSGKGIVNGFIVIEGINISTWSHLDQLDALFNKGKYANMPVLLHGSDGHTGWANKMILAKAGLNKNFIQSLSDEKKKYFGYDPSFTPNGFFADSGFEKINPVLPAVKVNWLLAGEKGVEYNNALGITAWLDPAAGNISSKMDNDILSAYQSLADKNELNAHIRAVVVADANADPLPQIKTLNSLQQKYNSTKDLSVIGFKIFADGVVEHPTQTAALSKPYLNKPSSGVLMYEPKKFAAFVIAADKANLLVHTHAIGDLAVTETLNGIEAARKTNGNSIIPHSITHIQFAQPSDFDRFKTLNVPASMQLLWAYGDVTTIDIIKPYIDPSIYKWQYPARSLMQAGAMICGASDWPVSSANPFEAIYNAETRSGPLGVLDSAQCIPRIDMLYAYTINSAKLLMMERSIGSIEPGKYADLILTDRDVLTVSLEKMRDTKILWTMFEGKIVYKQK